MKRSFIFSLTLLLSMATVDATAQNLMKKIGNAVEKEITKEVKEQVNKGLDNAFDGMKKDSSQPAKAQNQQAQPAKTNAAQPAVKSNGEKKFVKNIDLYYKMGDVRGNYPLYYDGSHYYLDIKGAEVKLTPCEAEFLRVKYHFFCVQNDIELFIKEELPGAVGPKVVKQ